MRAEIFGRVESEQWFEKETFLTFDFAHDLVWCIVYRSTVIQPPDLYNQRYSRENTPIFPSIFHSNLQKSKHSFGLKLSYLKIIT